MDPQVLLVYILMCTSTKCLIPILSKCQHAATQQLPYILERSLNWVVHRPDDQLVQSMLLRISHLSPSLAQLDSLTLYAILINKNSKIKKLQRALRQPPSVDQLDCVLRKAIGDRGESNFDTALRLLTRALPYLSGSLGIYLFTVLKLRSPQTYNLPSTMVMFLTCLLHLTLSTLDGPSKI